MLQVPQIGSQHTPMASVRKASSVKKATAQKSAFEIAIAEYYAARRAERVADRRLDRLVKLHPDLEQRLPLVYIYTRASNGQKIYGRSMYDCERIFPPSLDGSRPEYVALRQRFEEELKKARPAYEQQRRRDAGIEALERAAGKAGGRSFAAFQKLLRMQPTTVRELGLLSRFLIKELPTYAGGHIWRTKLAGLGEYRDYQERRGLALASVEVALRAWAKL